MGDANHSWKGGRYFKEDVGNYKGPAFVRCPADLPTMAKANGYILEHRLLMARAARRPLLRVEVVHHINHNTRDNRIENLELWPSNSAHKLAENGRFVEGAACRLFLTD
jgi:hypothetical protein